MIHVRPFVVRSLLALLPLLPVARDAAAQQDSQALASAWVQSLTPATDDPDATARALLTAALRQPRSPAAWLLVQDVMTTAGALQDPAAMRAWLAPQLPGVRMHGRLQDRCTELLWRLDIAVRGQYLAGPQPPAGYAQHHVLTGPFGDEGDQHAGIVFAPELQFPALGSTLPGRGGPARTATIRNPAYSDYLEFEHPERPLAGCHYGLTRWRTAAAVDAFLEVGCNGDFQVFVDGVGMARIERWRENAPRLVHVPLHLPAGEHTVLLKTCSNETNRVILRWLDADSAVLAAVQQLEVTDPNAPTAAPAVPRDDRLLTGLTVFTTAAAAADATAELRLAALLAALRDGQEDLALTLVEPLRRTPPSDPQVALAFAIVLRSVPLPDELRKAEARTLIEQAAPQLGAAHHGARLQQAQLLDEQDQRERALRLLAEHPAAGPATFARRHGLLQQLHFEAEIEPLLHEWAERCPRDPRPRTELGELAAARGDSSRALAAFRQALALRVDNPALVQAWRLAMATGAHDEAARWFDVIEPPNEPATIPRLRGQHDLAEARGDTAAALTALRALLTHPRAQPDLCNELARLWQRHGDLEATIACLRQSLLLDADQPMVRAWLTALGQEPPLDATFAPHRRDGQALAAAFTPGEREQGASTTVVFDQRVMFVAEDGSAVTEVHTLRRINDQQGVEAFSQGTGLGDIGELLVLRTIGTDGKTYVPSRIDEDYSLQRLEPGAFVEWRFRVHGAAPGAEPLETTPFVFGGSEPHVHSELVLALPTTGRGELRTRGLGAPTRSSVLADGRRLSVFVREDVAKLPQERFAPAELELLPCAQVGEDQRPFAAWRQHRRAQLARTRPTALLRTQAETLFTGLPDDRARAAAAWDFCQREIEDGPGDRAIDILLRKKGNRLLLTVALLRAAGVPVVPLVADAQRAELGEGDESLFPPARAMAVPGAAVLLADGERIHLFADLPRHWPLGVIPAARSATAAVLLHDDRVESIVLPLAVDGNQSLRVRGRATVQEKQLRLEARATIGDTQGAQLAQRVRELKGNTQKMAARQVAQQLFQGWRVEAAAFATDGVPGALTIAATLTRSGVQRDGDRFLAPLPLPPSKFVTSYGDRAERTLPFRFPGDLLSDWQIELEIGSELRLSVLPEPVLLDLGPLRFEQTCQLHGDTVTLRRHVRIAPATLPAERFGEWLRVLAGADRAEQTTLTLRAVVPATR